MQQLLADFSVDWFEFATRRVQQRMVFCHIYASSVSQYSENSLLGFVSNDTIHVCPPSVSPYLNVYFRLLFVAPIRLSGLELVVWFIVAFCKCFDRNYINRAIRVFYHNGSVSRDAIPVYEFSSPFFYDGIGRENIVASTHGRSAHCSRHKGKVSVPYTHCAVHRVCTNLLCFLSLF